MEKLTQQLRASQEEAQVARAAQQHAILSMQDLREELEFLKVQTSFCVGVGVRCPAS